MVISDRLRSALRMALCDDDAYAELIADGNALAFQDRILFELQQSVACVANATYVGGGKPILIPAGTFVKCFIIEADAPSGTAGGAKTIQYSVGTAVNADGDLTDATDFDVMIASGAKVAVASVHGDVALDNQITYFTDIPFGLYFAADTILYVNYIGQSAGATAAPGSVTCNMRVYALISKLY
jgi:hypothetical protein